MLFFSIYIKYFLFFYKFRQTLQKYCVILSFALTHKEGGNDMSNSDLIWNLVTMLIDRIENSKNEEKTKDNDN